jgi:hypothetical protein
MNEFLERVSLFYVRVKHRGPWYLRPVAWVSERVIHDGILIAYAAKRIIKYRR